MIKLPLFPLNTVLFPGVPLYLHIFEEQYKVMINRCIELRQPFGVILASNDNLKSPLDAKPFTVGCTAQITQVQPLEQGRLNIATVGGERFKLISLDYTHPYLVGNIELFPITNTTSTKTLPLNINLREKVRRYFDLIQKTGKSTLSVSTMPTEFVSFIYFSASLLEIPVQQKQELLEIEDIKNMIRAINSLYRSEVELMEILLNPPIDSEFYGTFSLN